MNRQQVSGARLLEHRPHLLGIGVIMNPWIVGADRKDRELGRILCQRTEQIRVRAVAPEQYAATVLLEHETIEAVLSPVRRPSLAPMVGAHRGNLQPRKLRALAPSKLAYILEAERRDDLRTLIACDHGGGFW